MRNKHLFPSVLALVALIAIGLTACSYGSVPVEKIPEHYACTRAYKLEQDMLLNQVVELTKPRELESTFFSSRDFEQWRAEILKRSGVTGYSFKKGKTLYIPMDCPKGQDDGLVTVFKP